MTVYGDESVTISQLKSILTISKNGSLPSIEEHNTDSTSHADIRNLVDNVQMTADEALTKAEEALNRNPGGASSMIPFRIEMPKCTNPSSNSSLNDNPGSWIKLGHWNVASFYSSSNFIIGGVYNDDMIQITGVSSDYLDNVDTCYEFIENYVFAVKRDDGVETEYNAPEGGVASITIADPSSSSSGTFVGNAHYMYWPHYVDNEHTTALKFWGVSAISMEDRSLFVYDGKKKYKILNVSLNFSVCRKDLLKTASDS